MAALHHTSPNPVTGTPAQPPGGLGFPSGRDVAETAGGRLAHAADGFSRRSLPTVSGALHRPKGAAKTKPNCRGLSGLGSSKWSGTASGSISTTRQVLGVDTRRIALVRRTKREVEPLLPGEWGRACVGTVRQRRQVSCARQPRRAGNAGQDQHLEDGYRCGTCVGRFEATRLTRATRLIHAPCTCIDARNNRIDHSCR
jgi:hypothetical protein